jgi:hypothetical protein
MKYSSEMENKLIWFICDVRWLFLLKMPSMLRYNLLNSCLFISIILTKVVLLACRRQCWWWEKILSLISIFFSVSCQMLEEETLRMKYSIFVPFSPPLSTPHSSRHSLTFDFDERTTKEWMKGKSYSITQTDSSKVPIQVITFQLHGNSMFGIIILNDNSNWKLYRARLKCECERARLELQRIDGILICHFFHSMMVHEA